MTYCLGMKLREGLVFMSDSRTNAGVDSVATFRKTFVFEGEDRAIVILTAGNLAITQSVISLLEERLDEADPNRSIMAAVSLYDVARLIGAAVREVFDADGEHLRHHGAEFTASLIVGGQIHGRRMRLFNIYAAGNFIEATDETPYFQIGETKYGKPIIERVLTPDTPMVQAIKCGLVSFDSTIKSNLSVAPPLDLVVVPANACKAEIRRRIAEDDPYWNELRVRWGEGLRALFDDLPDPSWAP